MPTPPRITLVLLAAGLTGCVAVPVHPPGPPLLVAYPGPAKTDAEFHQDDTLCQTASTQPAAPNTELTPGQIYLRCMASRGDVIQPVQQAQTVAYGWYPSYPVYAVNDGYYPWLYGGYVGFGFGGYGGGFYRGGWGGYRGGGWGGGWGGGYRGGGGWRR